MFWLTSAFAATYPIVVRVEAGSLSAPVTVTATADGQSADGSLADDGERPDVAANDGRWSGVVHLDGTHVELKLAAGGKVIGSAAVDFASADGPRDVDLRLVGNSLTASVNAGGGSAPPPVDGSSPGDGVVTTRGEGNGAAAGASPAPQGAPGGGGGGGRGPGGVSFPSGQSDNGLLFIGFGVSLLVALGVGWLWTRQRARPGIPSEVTVLPEPGLVDPRLPSLSDGLTAWIAEDGATDILQPLLAQIAAHHRVLVVGRASVTVRPVHGGPVYRLVGVKPSLAGDVAEALTKEPGARVVVLLVLEESDGEALRDYRDLLPREVGGVALLPRDSGVSLPKVAVRKDGEGWILRHAEQELRVLTSPTGLDLRRD